MGRRCCCIRGCLIHSDNFNRANNTNLGDGWKEEAGDSDIYDQTLRIPASGIVLSTYSHPYPHESGWIAAKLINPNSGDKLHLILNYTNSSNYLFGEFEYGGSNWTIRTYRRSGGGNTLLDEMTYSVGNVDPEEGEVDQLILCYDGKALAATTSDAENEPAWAWHCCEPAGDGKEVGIGNGNSSGSIQADDWAWYEHAVTNWRSDCPICVCTCYDPGTGFHCMKYHLLLTFTASGSCSPLNGQQMVMELQDEPTDPFPGSEHDPVLKWAAVGNVGGTDWEFRMSCQSAGAGGDKSDLECWEWMLCAENTDACINIPPEWTIDGCTSEWNGALPYDCTCEPFVLEFGPFHVGIECGEGACLCVACQEACPPPDDPRCAGTYWITITKNALYPLGA